MGAKPRVKMSKEQRAKQFMPFAALKGYEEAVVKNEKRYIIEKEREVSFEPLEI